MRDLAPRRQTVAGHWRRARRSPKTERQITGDRMSHITLIRHGQANTAARDEISYDRLSALGAQQSAWLGDYLRANRDHHTRLYCGSLNRHLETAAAMATGLEPVVDPRLNELEYFTLATLMETHANLPVPQEREGFVAHLPRLFTAWQRDEIPGAPERFEAFETRVRTVLDDIRDGDGPALVVTSGGVIAMALRGALDLEIPSMARVALAIMNTSVNRLFPIGDTLSPVLFNAVPHLADPERHHAQTHL
jgi:broad specificity phosphatase PhoE